MTAAVWAARRGFRVFRLPPRSKAPPPKGWQELATSEPGRVAALWREAPRCNYGIATGPGSGCWVLDVDGDAGARTLAELEGRHGSIPATLMVRTGAPGLHVFFAAAPVPNRVRFAEGLDARGDGGYVVGPGSVHPSGRLYELAVDAPIVPAPAWLLAMVARPAAPEPQLGLRFEDRRDRYLTRALEDAAEKVAAAAEGRRNWTLNREAFALAGLGLDLGTIAVELLAAAERAGLGRAEARRTLASGFRAGRRRPRAA